MANPNARGTIGNKGGGRKGYEIEEEQLKQMRADLSWVLAYSKAVRKGKATPAQHAAFQALEKIFMKEMDKLHANKQQTEITGNPEIPFIIEIIQRDDSKPTGEKTS